MFKEFKGEFGKRPLNWGKISQNVGEDENGNFSQEHVRPETLDDHGRDRLFGPIYDDAKRRYKIVNGRWEEVSQSD